MTLSEMRYYADLIIGLDMRELARARRQDKERERLGILLDDGHGHRVYNRLVGKISMAASLGIVGDRAATRYRERAQKLYLAKITRQYAPKPTSTFRPTVTA